VGCDDMAVAFPLLRQLRVCVRTRCPSRGTRGRVAVAAGRRVGVEEVSGSSRHRRYSHMIQRSLGPMPELALVFVASPEPVSVIGLADEKRAVADELRGKCCGVTGAPQGSAQLLPCRTAARFRPKHPRRTCSSTETSAWATCWTGMAILT
jgi:hypothetical protein